MSGFSPLYDDPELARAYARISARNLYNAAYERPAVRAVLGEVRGLDVLDAGAAAGEHAAWLAEQGARVVALDRSEHMVRLARARLGESVPVLRADLAQPLPLADAAFDLVLCSLTLHYLAEWFPALRELARVLRPRGRLVLSTHHPILTAEMVDDYHATVLVDDAFGGYAEQPVPVRYYHRPLQKIIAELHTAGFTVRALHEPRPGPDADAIDPEAAAKLRARPWFLIVDAESGAR